jgi:hypothetical protein
MSKEIDLRQLNYQIALFMGWHWRRRTDKDSGGYWLFPPNPVEERNVGQDLFGESRHRLDGVVFKDKMVAVKPEDVPKPYKDGAWSSPTVPHYSSDISAAMLVEDRIKELGLEAEYARALCEQVNGVGMINNYAEMFAIAHASAEDRCRAGLKVVGEER